MKTTISVNALLRRMAIEYIKMDDDVPVEEEGKGTLHKISWQKYRAVNIRGYSQS